MILRGSGCRYYSAQEKKDDTGIMVVIYKHIIITDDNIVKGEKVFGVNRATGYKNK